MLQSFKNFISEHRLFSQEHTLLLALSGGADSICLFHLLLKGGFNFSVAHCNFKLRGEESDGDEQFIIQLAKDNNIPFHTISFDTQTISLVEKTGIQETARKLRYDWFSELIKKHGFNKVLTAHHQTDNLETMLINILRNTGIKGLHGIPINENNIARPLLFTNKEAIETYLQSENIAYREDRSNSGNDYLRNELRHLVLPGLKGIQTDAEQCFFNTSRKVRSYEDIANELIGKQWKEITFMEEGNLKIDIEKLNFIENRIPFLYYNLQVFGFTFNQVEIMVNASQIGKRVISGSYALSLERSFYLLQGIYDVAPVMEVIVDAPEKQIRLANQMIDMDILDNSGVMDFKGKDTLYLNADKIEFPVKIRVWKEGDKLRPFGMNGYKKVSDILTDRKVENHKRKYFLIVENIKNEVIALLPNTIHNDYRVQPDTKRILSIGIKIVA